MIPSAEEVVILEVYVETEDLALKLYSNNVIPAKSDTAANYTVVAGGGYANITLDKDNWTITPGTPTTATYAAQDFDFTGATTAPSVIYGYFIVDGSGVLRGSERFPDSVIPFTPSSGSKIRVTPKFLVN